MKIRQIVQLIFGIYMAFEEYSRDQSHSLGFWQRESHGCEVSEVMRDA